MQWQNSGDKMENKLPPELAKIRDEKALKSCHEDDYLEGFNDAFHLGREFERDELAKKATEFDAEFKVLDLSAGNRAIWFDKENPLATFLDKRESVKPTVVCDTRSIPDSVGKDFDLVVFDPPHENVGANGNMTKFYGHSTRAEIKDTIALSSKEAHRLTKINALMAFKWNDHAFKLDDVLKLMPDWQPLFGHHLRNRGGSQAKTQSFWVLLKRISNGEDQHQQASLHYEAEAAQLKTKIEELNAKLAKLESDCEFKLADRRDKYEIAMKHGVDIYKTKLDDAEAVIEKLIEGLNEEKLVQIIYDWKHGWMDVQGTDEQDRKNYFSRAFGVDANMVYSLAKQLREKILAEIESEEK